MQPTFVASKYCHSLNRLFQNVSIVKTPHSRIIVHRCESTITNNQFALVQLTPFPSNPLRQAHSKLPKVLLQVAFTWQSSIPVSHSSISTYEEQMYDTIIIYRHKPDHRIFDLLTCTCESISSEPSVAHAIITPERVEASCIHVTFIRPSVTLRNVCSKIVKTLIHVTLNGILFTTIT